MSEYKHQRNDCLILTRHVARHLFSDQTKSDQSEPFTSFWNRVHKICRTCGIRKTPSWPQSFRLDLKRTMGTRLSAKQPSLMCHKNRLIIQLLLSYFPPYKVLRIASFSERVSLGFARVSNRDGKLLRQYNSRDR